MVADTKIKRLEGFKMNAIQALELLKKTLVNGSGTVHVLDGSDVSFKESCSYAVAYETIFTMPVHDTEAPLKNMTPSNMKDAFEFIDIVNSFDGLGCDGFTLGTWIKENVLTLEWVRLFDDLKDALRFAFLHNQDAIYDGLRKEDIAVNTHPLIVEQVKAFEETNAMQAINDVLDELRHENSDSLKHLLSYLRMNDLDELLKTLDDARPGLMKR